MTKEELGDAAGGFLKSIVNAIVTPLSGFIVLFIVTNNALGKVIPFDRNGDLNASIYCAYACIGIMMFIVIIISIMAIFFIEHLIYDKEARLRDKGKPPFGVKTESEPAKPNKAIRNDKNVTPKNE